MKIRFPEGMTKALTLSYDDGVIHDRALVRILNRFGIRGTFHLNSGKLGNEGYLAAHETRVLYQGHEIASHTMSHPNLCELDDKAILFEIGEDMACLSALSGYPARGFSYPFGAFNPSVVAALKSLNAAYGRTVHATCSFGIPEDFLLWHPTCHHNDGIFDLARSFRESDLHGQPLLLFSIWGHSYEFARNDNWSLMTEFCSLFSGDQSVWSATCLEVCYYLTAARQVRYIPGEGLVRNESAFTVWVSLLDEEMQLGPFETRPVR